MNLFRRPSVRYARTPEPETPYLKAAQVWDERIGSARVQAKNWRLMAFGWLAAPAVRRRWLLASLATATLLAVVRMTAGGHFLSDTIFAWFATYFGLWATEWAFRRLKWLPPSAE